MQSKGDPLFPLLAFIVVALLVGVLLLSRQIGIGFELTLKSCVWHALGWAALLAVRHLVGGAGSTAGWLFAALAIACLAWADAGAAILLKDQVRDVPSFMAYAPVSPWEPSVPTWYSWARYLVPMSFGGLSAWRFVAAAGRW